MKKLMVAAALAVTMLSGCAVYPIGHGYSRGYSAPAYSSYTVIAPFRSHGGGYGGGHGGGYGHGHGGGYGGGHGGGHRGH